MLSPVTTAQSVAAPSGAPVAIAWRCPTWCSVRTPATTNAMPAMPIGESRSSSST